MQCPRCAAEIATPGWCRECEQAFDTWVRRHAADIIWSVMGGGIVVAVLGMGLPLLGLGSLVAATAAFAGFGTVLGLHRAGQRRRRRQFLAGTALPRAYLTSKT